ncbi:SWF/SNF helicase family protein, partial [Klebsiella pneumoniae]|uniref:SWF/SNF helicase family protein n=1 Tax=Klebsiella pneumoniae TaxID=573 RepID=UPI000A87B8E9
QHCQRMAFVGMGDSYEQYYQAIRRCYRYGQTKVVYAHVIVSELESQIAANVARKEQQASDITRALVEEMRRVER